MHSTSRPPCGDLRESIWAADRAGRSCCLRMSLGLSSHILLSKATPLLGFDSAHFAEERRALLLAHTRQRRGT